MHLSTSAKPHAVKLIISTSHIFDVFYVSVIVTFYVINILKLLFERFYVYELIYVFSRIGSSLSPLRFLLTRTELLN